MYETLSQPFVKALTENSQNIDYADPGVRETEPVDDGTFVAGLGGIEGPQALRLLPYGAGVQGSQFKLRVYGWWHHGHVRDPLVMWLPLVLAEFEVTLGSKSGLANRLIKQNELFASEITLLSGNLGFYGSLTNGPIAHVNVGLSGCQKYGFDFAQGNLPGAFGNCLWAQTSPSV